LQFIPGLLRLLYSLEKRFERQEMTFDMVVTVSVHALFSSNVLKEKGNYQPYNNRNGEAVQDVHCSIRKQGKRTG